MLNLKLKPEFVYPLLLQGLVEKQNIKKYSQSFQQTEPDFGV